MVSSVNKGFKTYHVKYADVYVCFYIDFDCSGIEIEVINILHVVPTR